MAKMLMIYPDRCIGCNACEDICAVEHEGGSGITILTWEDEDFSVPLACQQCDDAACVTVCPTKAMHYGQPGANLVEFTKALCIGCKLCVVACPFGAVRYDAASKSVAKCDTCGGDPQCVECCPTDALEWVDDAVVTRARMHEVGEKLKAAFK